MNNKIYLVLNTIILIFVVFGCSSSNNPITSNSHNSQSDFDYFPVFITDCSLDGSVSAGIGILGLYQISIDPSNLTGELNNLRKGSLTDVIEVVDITNFLQLAPCTDCVKIKSIALDSNNYVVLTIGIKHPFPAGDPLKPITGRNRADLHVFNVEGMIVSDKTGGAALGQTYSGLIVLNADGYSGYLDKVLDEIYMTDDASIHPYITHFDDYSSGNFDTLNPMGFESVTDPPPSGNLVMAMGCDYDFQDYVIPIGERTEFIFVVGCTYGVSSASKSERFTPEYRIPQHNKKAASEIHVEIVSNNLIGGDTSSTATLHVQVVDISHGVPVGSALNEMFADSSVSEILVEIPGLTSGPVSFSSTPISGTGHDPSDPLVFEGTISNELGAPAGEAFGLIKVTDSYSPGQNSSPLLNGMDGIKRVDPISNPLTGLFSIDEFATYQWFYVTVGSEATITVIIPNGGEVWTVGTSEEITWDSQNVTGTVFIEYSKDNFVNDFIPIANNEDNDGSCMWIDIPNDPSNTVRVRVSMSGNPGIYDISDTDFSIVPSGANFGWAKTWGGFGSDWAFGVLEDGARNVYFNGYFENTVNFNPNPGTPVNLTSSGGQDVVLSKLNSAGELIWAKKWGGPSQDISRAMTMDSAGNIYVAGYFQGTSNFNPNPGTPVNLTSNGDTDSCVSKLTSNGDLVWAKSWGGILPDYGRGVAVDSSGNVYVGGYFEGMVNFNPNPGTPENRTSNGGRDPYLIKLDSNGNLVWAKTWGGINHDYGIYIDGDSAGNVCMTGHFDGTVNFNPNPGTPVNCTSVGLLDFYVSKFNTNGELQWAKSWGSDTYDYAAGVSIDGYGNVFVSGDFQHSCNFNPWGMVVVIFAQGMDPCVSKFDSDGNFQWARAWGGSGHDRSYACAAGPDGSVCISGHFNATANFNPNIGPPVEYTSNGMTDVYLIKLDELGVLQWARAFGGSLNDFGYATHIANSGNVYVAGDYQQTVDFSPNPGTPDYHTAIGGYDHFVVKYLSNGDW